MKKMNAKKLKMIQLITFFGGIIIVRLLHMGYQNHIIPGPIALIITLIIMVFGGWVLKQKSDDR